MFISKSKYKEKLDLIERLKEMNGEKYSKIQDLQLEISKLETKFNGLDYNFTRLQEENQKLINWIEKIINDLGAYEVSSSNAIRVPVYNRKPDKAFGTENAEENIKEIVLPQIIYMVPKK